MRMQIHKNTSTQTAFIHFCVTKVARPLLSWENSSSPMQCEQQPRASACRCRLVVSFPKPNVTSTWSANVVIAAYAIYERGKSKCKSGGGRLNARIGLAIAISRSPLLLALSLESREELSALENELEKDISWCEQRGGWEEDCQAQRQWDTASVLHLDSPLLQALCLLKQTGVTGLIPGSKGKVWAKCRPVIEEWLAAMPEERR